MKKNLFIMVCMLLCMSGAKATVHHGNVEIDGFIYNLDNMGDYDYQPTWYAELIGITDQHYAEVCAIKKLSLASTVEFEGDTYTVVSLRNTFFENSDFQNLESIILPDDLSIVGTDVLSNMPELKMITNGGNIDAYLAGSLNNLPSLSEIQLSSSTYQQFRSTFVNVGVSSLIFPSDASIDRIEESFCSLPNLNELSLCKSKAILYSFKEIPLLNEITFDCAPFSTKNSFCELPMLRKINFKKWNEQNQISFDHESFTTTPQLQDVYVEEKTPCEFSHSLNAPAMTLHVPVGSSELYAAAEGWKNFGKIVEYDPAGVDATEADATQTWSCMPVAGGLKVSSDSAVTVEVVSPAGAVVKRVAVTAGETVAVDLPAGVYIVAGSGQSIKVCVR